MEEEDEEGLEWGRKEWWWCCCGGGGGMKIKRKRLIKRKMNIFKEKI